MKFLVAGIVMVACMFLVIGTNGAADKDKKEEKPKFTIKEVMKKAHAGDNALRKKVLKGEATDEEKAQLTAMYIALSQNAPPKGEADDWKKITKTIIDAYKDGDLKAYAKATDCKACHSKFK